MEDYGYTFEDLAQLTRNQRRFLFFTKAERMREEAEEIAKIKAQQENTGKSPQKRPPLRRRPMRRH